jgi:hypothetical protein
LPSPSGFLGTGERSKEGILGGGEPGAGGAADDDDMRRCEATAAMREAAGRAAAAAEREEAAAARLRSEAGMCEHSECDVVRCDGGTRRWRPARGGAERAAADT